jgi:hypothetical protein
VSSTSLTLKKELMILIYKITPQTLSTEGKDHKWPPCECEKCQRSMWGHGFVTRYFSGLNQIFLKRYRCPNCGTVVTTRPEGFRPWIRSSTQSIYQILRFRISSGQWSPETNRQRGGHWLRRFAVHAKMSCETNLLTFLDRCFEKEVSFFA